LWAVKVVAVAALCVEKAGASGAVSSFAANERERRPCERARSRAPLFSLLVVVVSGVSLVVCACAYV
jgi:hypothetical protein